MTRPVVTILLLPEHHSTVYQTTSVSNTNSTWLPWCCSGRVGRQKNDDWLHLFDVVIVGCAKPGFFCERRPLFAVNPVDGTLMNTDNGAPIIPIGEEDLPTGGVSHLSSLMVVVLGPCCALCWVRDFGLLPVYCCPSCTCLVWLHNDATQILPV